MRPRDSGRRAAHCEFCSADLLQPNRWADPNPFAEANPYVAPAVESRPAAAKSNDLATRLLLPVGRSPYAIAASYAGLCSLVVCFLGPVAILLGVLAVRDIQKHPELTGLPRAICGLAGGAVGCLFLAFALLRFSLR